MQQAALIHIKPPLGDMTKALNKTKNLVGKRFGDLEAIKFSYRQMQNSRRSYHLCSCVCGTQEWIQSTKLISGLINKCAKCAYRKAGKGCPTRWLKRQYEMYPEGLFPARWNGIKSCAQKRGIEFSISYEYACDLYKAQNKRCALSGLKIYFDKSKISTGTASLDRIDNSIGYVDGNVHWVHKMVNLMKLDYKKEHFILMCRFVAENTASLELSDGSGIVIPPFHSPLHPRADKMRWG